MSKCHRGPEEVKCQRAHGEVLLLPRVVTHALTTWVLSMWQLPNQTKLNKLDRYTVTKMPEEGGRLGQCHVCSSQQVKLWAIWVKTLKLWANLNQNTKTNLTQKVVGMERQYVQWVRLHFTEVKWIYFCSGEGLLKMQSSCLLHSGGQEFDLINIHRCQRYPCLLHQSPMSSLTWEAGTFSCSQL